MNIKDDGTVGSFNNKNTRINIKYNFGCDLNDF